MAREHTEDGLVLRYRLTDDRNIDGLAGSEGTFVLCSFWLASALASADHPDRAKALFDRVAGFATDLGLLTEESDPHNGELLRNFPQAFSHVGLINAAAAIDQADGTLATASTRRDGARRTVTYAPAGAVTSHCGSAMKRGVPTPPHGGPEGKDRESPPGSRYTRKDPGVPQRGDGHGAGDRCRGDRDGRGR
ncbi:glycoside hydrolase family 15 protein [Streptomyces sp. G-G2]|uniref:glycoside hydrolase family 15 protein n=1 Tax=Streptomyces sp. G-G2 TaxID=3046201 RepID=UPI0024BAAF32|nr:glycoside hydrolase family 15 protein [Streptomyces sp. G-G2]MDJ0382124.1 glycoside hydrolase family 15 protein [Streptomyces sp. G-G2]